MESDNFLSKGGGVADFDFHDHRPAFTMNKHTLYGRQNLRRALLSSISGDSRAEVLISVTVRVEGGSSQEGAQFFFGKTNTFCVRSEELKLLYL